MSEVMPDRVHYIPGLRMPPGTKRVCAPSRWASPISVRRYGRDWLVGFPAWMHGFETIAYATELRARTAARDIYELHAGPFGCFELAQADIDALRGLHLADTVPLGLPSHADVLLDWANRPMEV